MKRINSLLQDETYQSLLVISGLVATVAVLTVLFY